MKNTKIKRYLAGDVILHEGEYNKTLHKILSGKVALYLNYGKTNEYLIEMLSFPHYFGEVSILIQHPSYCTVVAVEDASILHIPAENFEDFIANNTHNALLIMKAMAKSLDSLNLLLHKIEHGTHPHTHAKIEEEVPLLSTAEFLSMPDSKTLFMQEHIEDELHEKIRAAEQQTIETPTHTAPRAAQPSVTQYTAPPTAETSSASFMQYMLPDVYPDFYLPGHKCYPNITHPEYKEFVFHKEYTCPNCNQTFDGERISYNRLKVDPEAAKKLRLDFHILYQNFEAEWYDVVTCPHCYFSSLIDMFLKTCYVRKDYYQEQLLQIRASMLLDFSAEKTLDFVFLQHYIALACSIAFANHRQINACIWMNLCWLYRSVNDQEMIRLAENKTIEAYDTMYRECDLSIEQQQRTCLTIASIYFERGDYLQAREWAFAVRTYREGKVIYRNLAQSVIDEVRYLLSEERKEEEAKKRAEAARIAQAQKEEAAKRHAEAIRIAEAQREEEARRLAELKEAARREAEAKKQAKLKKREEEDRKEAFQNIWGPQGKQVLA